MDLPGSAAVPAANAGEAPALPAVWGTDQNNSIRPTRPCLTEQLKWRKNHPVFLQTHKESQRTNPASELNYKVCSLLLITSS